MSDLNSWVSQEAEATVSRRDALRAELATMATNGSSPEALSGALTSLALATGEASAFAYVDHMFGEGKSEGRAVSLLIFCSDERRLPVRSNEACRSEFVGFCRGANSIIKRIQGSAL